eukprot:8102185-Ditylum_brightwellii.AAC.1
MNVPAMLLPCYWDKEETRPKRLQGAESMYIALAERNQNGGAVVCIGQQLTGQELFEENQLI